MGIFSSILDKLRGRAAQTQTQPSATPGSESAMGGVVRTGQTQQQSGAVEPMQSRVQAGQQAGAQAGLRPASHPSGVLQDVDVEAVLAQMASHKQGGGGNYRESIVDLLKLLDLDSSLAARKELAEELGVHAGAHGSAEQNVALRKAVMRKLAENGGRVPASLRD
jgi:hypothetical protein